MPGSRPFEPFNPGLQPREAIKVPDKFQPAAGGGIYVPSKSFRSSLPDLLLFGAYPNDYSSKQLRDIDAIISDSPHLARNPRVKEHLALMNRPELARFGPDYLGLATILAEEQVKDHRAQEIEPKVTQALKENVTSGIQLYLKHRGELPDEVTRDLARASLARIQEVADNAKDPWSAYLQAKEWESQLSGALPGAKPRPFDDGFLGGLTEVDNISKIGQLGFLKVQSSLMDRFLARSLQEVVQLAKKNQWSQVDKISSECLQRAGLEIERLDPALIRDKLDESLAAIQGSEANHREITLKNAAHVNQVQRQLKAILRIGNQAATLEKVERCLGEKGRAMWQKAGEISPVAATPPMQKSLGCLTAFEKVVSWHQKPWSPEPGTGGITPQSSDIRKSIQDIVAGTKDQALGRRLLKEMGVKAFFEGYPVEARNLLESQGHGGTASENAAVLRDLVAVVLAGNGPVETEAARSFTQAPGEGGATPRGPPRVLQALLPEPEVNGWRPPVRENATSGLPPLEESFARHEPALREQIQNETKQARETLPRQKEKLVKRCQDYLDTRPPQVLGHPAVAQGTTTPPSTQPQDNDDDVPDYFLIEQELGRELTPQEEDQVRRWHRQRVDHNEIVRRLQRN